MRLTLSLCFALIVGSIVAVDLEDARALYEKFKQTYKKNYANDDDHVRFAIFKNNLKQAQEFQKLDQGTAEYGVTEFSDLTDEEFLSTYANARFENDVEQTDESLFDNLAAAPTSFDWREHGAVGPVLNQGHCGSCWAFSVVGNVEGQWFKKTGQLLTLSKQQLVDCDYRDHGCHGGYPLTTYGEIKRLGGLELESDYPYQALNKMCRMDKTKTKVYVNSSIHISKSEWKQAAWLAENGPMSTALNATPLKHYRSGIVDLPFWSCSPFKINHAVLTVGYGEENGKKFWIVKNSWSTMFGENGYFRIHRGGRNCGIGSMCTSAIIY